MVSASIGNDPKGKAMILSLFPEAALGTDEEPGVMSTKPLSSKGLLSPGVADTHSLQVYGECTGGGCVQDTADLRGRTPVWLGKGKTGRGCLEKADREEIGIR